MFRLKIHNEADGFWVDVYPGLSNTKVCRKPWKGGAFRYLDKEYFLRGPYHGLDTYQVFRLTPVPTEIEP